MGYDYGQGLKGAGGGAMAGFAVGGPVGAAIGGGLGLLGGFGGGESEQEKQRRQMLMDYYKQVQGRQPVGLGATQYGQTSGDIRSRQLGLADQLQSISNGTGPSLATEQLKQATDRNTAQQASFANTGRAGAMGAMQAANNSARLGAQAGQDAAVARMAEANQARQLLGLNLHGMRSADEDMSKFNAGQGNEMTQAGFWGRLKQMGMNDDAALNLMQQLGGQNAAVANRPGLGDQILAGGAGMYSTAMTQKAASRAAKQGA